MTKNETIGALICAFLFISMSNYPFLLNIFKQVVNKMQWSAENHEYMVIH